MSRETYVIRVVACDDRECFATFEGHSGEPEGSVAQQAKAEGWTIGPKAAGRDYCPDHRPAGGEVLA